MALEVPEQVPLHRGGGAYWVVELPNYLAREWMKRELG
jgi:hypothetical protein